jgi:hypothetical protein
MTGAGYLNSQKGGKYLDGTDGTASLPVSQPASQLASQPAQAENTSRVQLSLIVFMTPAAVNYSINKFAL